MSQSEIGTSRTHWFARGLGGGILVVAALNAISYFVRSSGWSQLLRNDYAGEAIGFPLEMWQGGNSYSGLFIDYRALGLNAMFALVCGSVLGLLAIWQMSRLNAWVSDIEEEVVAVQNGKLQFTIGGLLMGTAVVAIAASAARNLTPRPEALTAIFWLGPTVLIILALLPYRISWEYRVAVLLTAAVGLIATAIAVGAALNLEFDKVLLGIFVCWTPQSTLTAAGIMIGIFVKYYRRNNVERPQTKSAGVR